MRIALYHGWELTGSGSNEYTRYLGRALARLGHEVHVLCREPSPEKVDAATDAYAWKADGTKEQLFHRTVEDAGFVVHQLPHAAVRPVFVTDKQRSGNVKAFVDMTEQELDDYLDLSVRTVSAILTAFPVDVLHANHLVVQPTVAARACGPLEIPFIIYPHGSSIEYTVRKSERFRVLAGEAIEKAKKLIIGSKEVQQRILELYPDWHDDILRRSEIIGVGVDTSLFAPVPPEERKDSIAQLIAAKPTGGKSPELVNELKQRVSNEIEAVHAYKDAYVRAMPDSDAAEHLGRIPFQRGKVLLFVGALTVGKGIQSLIAAMPAILKEANNAHLVIVGSGAYREVLEALVHAICSSDEQLLDTLAERGNDLDDSILSGGWTDVAAYLADPEAKRAVLSVGPAFDDHVHFVGRLNHDLLKYLFPCVDVAVFPSVIPEAYPLVLMESLANGVLPAATNFSGFAEGLDMLVPHLGEEVVNRMRLPLNPEKRVAAIAEGLTTLLLAPPAADLRAIAVREYDWAIRAEAMARAYG